jgi:Protein of unknown function (DUF1592)/Protein of unknown function (DUF1588)/Protein of unknown function (DUF1595)/Protein of unknown function (DUF1587)
MPRSFTGIALWVACASGLGACAGTIEGGGSPQATGAAGAAGAAGTGGGATAALVPARIRRLTNAEYDASVQALLGTKQTPAASTFPPDARQGGFSLNDAQRVDPVLAKQLSGAADALATEAAANGTLARLAPCADPQGGGAACGKTFIQSFGAAAYRRPLTDVEGADLATLYAAGADATSGGTYADGVGLVVRGALQSAGFLYLTELGDGAGPPPVPAFDLGAFETASALAYLIAAGPPDDALLAAARAGGLASPDAREQQTRRLLATPAGQARIVRVVREWLGIDDVADVAKDTTVYPDFATVRSSIDAESVRFVGEVTRAGPHGANGMLGDLLGADWSVVDAPLAGVYGVTVGTDTTAGGAPRTSLAGAGRRGILNQAAFLSVFAHASETAPVLRGVAVMRRVACLDVPSPTSLNIVVTPPVPDPTKTTRQRFDVHAKDTVCAACHGAIDGIGFSFEGFDAMGRARTTDANQPVDTATVVAAGADFDGSYADSDALAVALAGSADVRTCAARQLFRASVGRSDATIAATEQAFVDAWKAQAGTPTQQSDLVETIVAFVRSPLFTRRSSP